MCLLESRRELSVRDKSSGAHRIYTDKEPSVRALAKYIGRNVDRDVFEKTWDLLSESVLPENSILRLKASRQS